jgi:hypothetical protein
VGLVLDISLIWNVTNVSFFFFSLGTGSWTWNFSLELGNCE